MAKRKKVGRGKGGVAPISPHVGNLSHINLTPNFHTYSSMWNESCNSLIYSCTCTHKHTHALKKKSLWIFLCSRRGPTASQPRINQAVRRAWHICTPCSNAPCLPPKHVLALTSTFVITLTKLISTSSSRTRKTMELDFSYLPESSTYLEIQMGDIHFGGSLYVRCKT